MKNSEHREKVSKAIERGKLLPETNQKVEFYSEIIDAEESLISKYRNRQGSVFIGATTKAKERIEIIKLQNSVNQKQKVYDNYLKRKAEYEVWMDEMTLEASEGFDLAMSEAKEIPYASNPRVHDAITKFEKQNDVNTIHDKIQFYLFLKNEVSNYQKSKRSVMPKMAIQK